MKKIVFSDIDGTLVENGKCISYKDQLAIHEFRKKGHKFVFCTGRNIQQVQIFAQMFEYDYMILNNGGLIVDKDGNYLYHKQMNNGETKEIIQMFLKKYPYLHCSFYDGHNNLSYNNGKIVIYKIKDYVPSEIDYMEYLNASSYDFDTFCIYNPNKNIEEVLEVQKYLHETKKNIHGILNRHYLDVVQKDVTKGNGIQILLSLLGNNYESYGIGDSYNDFAMFENVQYPYTFHKVTKEVKEKTCGQVDFVYQLLQKIE